MCEVPEILYLIRKCANFFIVYKQQKFIPNNTRAWEIQDQDANKFGVCLLPGYRQLFLCYFSIWWKG